MVGGGKVKILGRMELLEWLNSMVESDYAKIEHLADGVAYIQLLDAAFPGRVPLQRVNFNSRFEDEHVLNLRLLQDLFKKLHVPRMVPVEKLAKGRFADHMEFLQWFYQYMTKNFPDCETYSGFARRMEAEGRQGRTDKIEQGIGAAESESEIDVQRRSELENLLTTLTAELGERLQDLQQAHNRNTQMKKDRDNLFEQLRHVEGVCKAERHLPGTDDVLAILASSTHEF